jgi:tetratricopeptide (TPR) repeat protein
MPLLAKPKARLLLAISILYIMAAGCGSSPQVYLERGNRFFDVGKFDDAQIQYQKAIQKSPKFGEAHYRLALVELQKNQPVAAYRELQRAVELMPGNTTVLAKLGQLALSIYNVDQQHPKQLYDQAAKASAELAKQNPEGFDANMLQGALDLVGKKPADAVSHLRKAMQKKPDDLDAQLGLARALVLNNQTPEAIDLAQSMVAKHKTFGPAYDFLYDEYRLTGKPDEAGNILKLKADNNPKQAAYLVQLARYYAGMRKPAEMTATIQRLLDDPADFPNGLLVAGDFYASTGQPDEALRQYEKGLASPTKDSTAKDSLTRDTTTYRKRISGILVAQRKWSDAYVQVAAILKEHPDDQETKMVRALIWLDEGKPENLDPAIAELRAQQVKRPQDPVLHYQIGNALARKNDVDGARREWLAATKQSRSYLPPRFALVQLDLSQNKPNDALPIAEEIAAADPRNPQARLLLATCLTAAGQYQRARAELNQLVTQFPQSPQVRFRIGLLDLSEGKFKEAEDVFRHFEGSAASEPEVLAGLAQAYQGQNESMKAIQLLQDQLKRKPDSTALRRSLAHFAVASKNYDVAIEQYKLLAVADPKSTDVALSLAAAYNAKGDHPAAVEVLKKASETDPKSLTVNLELAQMYVVGGRLDDAKAMYRHVLQIQPNNPNALNDLAYLMADSGENLDEALSFAQRGLQTAVSPALKTSLSDTLGWIYLKKKMNDSALQTFQSLVRSNPGNMTFRYHLGAALYQKGDAQAARAELQTALSSKPASSDEPKIRELLALLDHRS